MGRFRDLTGERFGRLLVLQKNGYNKHHQLYWLCECECGNRKSVLGFVLGRGECNSCGCLKKESIAKVNFSHGMAATPIYRIWRSMMQRCCDKNSHAYDRYGGRGINVCNKWQTFEGFYKDMGDKPKGMSLERLNNDGDYCLENVVWADAKAQANNRRSNVVLEHNGKKQNMQQWCDELNLKIGTVWARINRGWDVSRALTQGVRNVG
jgi:hypothetical protein